MQQPAPAPDVARSPGRLTLASLLLRTASVWVRHLVPFTVVGLVVDLPIAAIELRGPRAGDDIVPYVLLLFLLWVLRIAGTAAVSVGVLQALAGGRATSGPSSRPGARTRRWWCWAERSSSRACSCWRQAT